MAGTKHGSRVIVLAMQRVSQTLVRANLMPKNFCLGLIKPEVLLQVFGMLSVLVEQ